MLNILLVSNLILWLLVIGLALVVLALARQVGLLHERVAPAGALMIPNRLQPGSEAPVLESNDLNSADVVRVGGQRERSQLLLFVSPDCPVCKTLIPVIKSVAQAESAWLDLVFASDGERDAHLRFIESHGLQGFAYLSSETIGKQFGVSKLPYAVLLDPSGEVASLGLVNSREHLESLFESMERGVPSIQAYFQAHSAAVAGQA